MANFIQKTLTSFLTERCYDEFFIKFNFLHGPCISTAISKCLGLGIIVGSTLVKLPQILKILKAKSAEGIALLSILLELTALASASAYSFSNGYPFSAWGETFFLLVESLIIGFLVLFYSGHQSRAFLFVSSWLGLVYVLMSGITPLSVLWGMQALNIPIVLAAKSLQAMVNYRNGHTGQLSAITLILLFMGSMARIFTSYHETADTLMVMTYVAATFANCILVVQLAYYWDATNRALAEPSHKKAH